MDDPDPTERRRHARVRAVYRLAVRVEDEALEGMLLDLSREGLRVRFLGDAALTDVKRLWIQLPRWSAMEGELSLPGHFAWFKPADDFRGPEGGFAFDALTSEERARVDLLMDRILQAAEEDGLLAHALCEVVPGVGASLF